MNGGGALVDIDGDADLDVYRTMYNQPNQLLLNDGSGHFAPPRDPSGLEVEGASGTPLFADFDDDGDIDSFVTPTNYGRPYLLINEGGTFTDQTEARGIALEFRDVFGEFGSFAFAANTFDFDHDGDLDILVGEWGAVQNVHGRGDTHRSYAFVNDGAGKFTERADDLGLAALRDSAVFGFAWMDLDGDTWEEMLVAGDFGTSMVFKSQQGEYFAESTSDYLKTPVRGTSNTPLAADESAYNAMGSALADIDPESPGVEWLVTAIGSTEGATSDAAGCGLSLQQSSSFDAGLVTRCTGNRVYGLENGVLVDRSAALGVRDSGWSWGAVVADLDLDGLNDVAVTNGYVAEYAASVTPPTIAIDGSPVDVTDLPVYRAADGDANTLWLGSVGGPFEEVASDAGFDSRAQGRALVGGDVDADGDIDVIQINDGNEPLELYINGTDPSSDRWVGLRKIAMADAPPSCIGCRVSLLDASDEIVSTVVISGSGSYSSFSPAVAHFGLPEPSDEVKIRVSSPAGATRDVVVSTGAWSEVTPE